MGTPLLNIANVYRQQLKATNNIGGTSSGVPQANESVLSNQGLGGNVWMPSQIMSLNGSSDAEKYLKSRLNNLKISWDQGKVDALWHATTEIYSKYGIQVDPRFLLAIIIQEGTGSFNTSSENKTADGQHGIETDFALDLMKANSLVFGKILGYIYYGNNFKRAVLDNYDKPGITGTGDIFQYANWYTPIIDVSRNRIRAGVYAGHGAWHVGVRRIYERLSYTDAPIEYSNYLSNINKTCIDNITKGMRLTLFSFVPLDNAQDSRGRPTGEYTIVVK